jgi:hypothetical protein
VAYSSSVPLELRELAKEGGADRNNGEEDRMSDSFLLLAIVCRPIYGMIYMLSISVYISVGGVLAPDQKWRNRDNSAVLMIDKVNKINSTFAGAYAIIRDDIKNSEFPFRGEFDPQGITIGWVVSYWNDQVNDHALGAWAGYVASTLPDKNPEWIITATRIIAHENNSNTTSYRH